MSCLRPVPRPVDALDSAMTRQRCTAVATTVRLVATDRTLARMNIAVTMEMASQQLQEVSFGTARLFVLLYPIQLRELYDVASWIIDEFVCKQLFLNNNKSRFDSWQ